MSLLNKQQHTKMLHQKMRNAYSVATKASHFAYARKNRLVAYVHRSTSNCSFGSTQQYPYCCSA